MYKKYTLKLLGMTIGLGLLFFGLYSAMYYVLDPLQIWHRSWFHSDRLDPNMRKQAAGIINNFEFDSIILGTSMLENSSAKEAGESLGGKFFNLSIGGSNFHERSVILGRALDKKLRHVIYSLDHCYLSQERDNQKYGISLWDFLYDRQKWKAFKVYYTQGYLFGIGSAGKTVQCDFDRPLAWYAKPEFARRLGRIEGWVASDSDWIQEFVRQTLPQAAMAVASGKKPHFDPASMKKTEAFVRQYFEDYVISFVRNNPQTKFHLIFPPYYRFVFANLARNEPDKFHLHQYAARHLAKLAAEMPNLEVYGFEDMDFLDDIANYHDQIHYHKRYNSMFVEAMARQEHRLLPDNVEAYLQKCAEKALAFDIPDLQAKFEAVAKKLGR